MSLMHPAMVSHPLCDAPHVYLQDMGAKGPDSGPAPQRRALVTFDVYMTFKVISVGHVDQEGCLYCLGMAAPNMTPRSSAGSLAASLSCRQVIRTTRHPAALRARSRTRSRSKAAAVP